jgi:hypothetical protein
MHPTHNKSYIDKLQIEIDILDWIQMKFLSEAG